jgi:hypothetical protein
MIYVMTQFEKYGTGLLPENFPIWLARFLLLIHDIAKPLAVQYENDKSKQHDYTTKFVAEMMKHMGFKLSEQKLILACLDKDYIGTYLQGKISKELAIEQLKNGAKRSGLDMYTFYKIIKMYYLIDASSYTEDAGAMKSLDYLFNFGENKSTVNFKGIRIVEMVESLEASLFE